MTKRTRTILFFALGTIFFSLAPAIILYSQGFRFSWNEMQFSKVGAFFLSISPTRAEVLINGKTIGKTARVLGTTLTEDFSPGTYSVRVQKEGYHSWEKRLEIFPKQVTEAKHITLLPEDPVFILLQNNIQNLWMAPNKTEMILQKSNLKNTWTLVFWNAQRNVEYPLYESPRLQDEMFDIQWASNSNAFLFRVVSREQTQTFLQRLDRNLFARQRTDAESLQAASQLRTSLNHLSTAGQQISFSPFQENQLLSLTPFRNSFALSRFDYAKGQPLTPLAQNVVTFLANDQQIAWFDQSGVLWRQTNKDEKPLQVNQTPFLPQAETSYAIHIIEDELFLQENQTLYLLNKQTQTFEEFFAPFYEMALSPDGKKIAISSGKEIWLYFLQEDLEQPPRTKTERVFLTRFSEDITNLTWFDAHYLLFARGNTLLVSEIDNRDRLNIVELATFSRPILFWQDSVKTLLVHTQDQIRASEKLLP